jgi:hypothetical protein
MVGAIQRSYPNQEVSLFPILFLAGQAIFGASAVRLINTVVPVAYVAIKEWEIEKRDDEADLGLNHKLASESYRLRYENIIKAFGSNTDYFSQAAVEDAKNKLEVPPEQVTQGIRDITWNVEGLPPELAERLSGLWWVTETEEFIIDSFLKLQMASRRQGPFYDYAQGVSERSGEDIMNLTNNFIDLSKAQYLDEQVRLIRELSERRKQSDDLMPTKSS